VVAALTLEGAGVGYARRAPEDREARTRAHLTVHMSLEAELASPARGSDGPEVTLVQGDLASLARALRLARRTVERARGNLGLGLGYHALALPLGVGIFERVWDISLGPIAGSAAGFGCLLLLVGHALYARRARS
jgi:cation transport ATPase